MEREHHDRVLAIVSHLPHLIAFTICGTADRPRGETKEAVVKFAAAGFRDFTRIAASDPMMWRDIFLNNREALLEMLGRFSEDLTALAAGHPLGRGRAARGPLHPHPRGPPRRPRRQAGVAGYSAMPTGTPPAFISTSVSIDPRILEGVGKVAVAWAQLDFVLRAACKRVEDVPWNSEQGKAIWQLPTHKNVIERMKQQLSDSKFSKVCKDAIRELLDEVGCGRGEGFYGQRNQAIHSVLWSSPDGATLAARVGNPVAPAQTLSVEELSELAEKIASLSKRLLELTYPTSDITIGPFHPEAEVSAAPWMKP